MARTHQGPRSAPAVAPRHLPVHGRARPLILGPAQRARFAAHLAARYGWQPEQYELAPLAGWEQRRLLVVSVLRRDVVGVALRLALLADGTVVGPGERGGLRRLVRQAFARLEPEEGPALARLALLFAEGGEGLGIPAWKPLVELYGSDGPLPGHEVSCERVNGGHLLRFCSFEPESGRAHACTLRLDGEGDVALTAERIPAPPSRVATRGSNG